MSDRKATRWKRRRHQLAVERKRGARLRRRQARRRLSQQQRVWPNEAHIFAPATIALEDPHHDALALYLAELRAAVATGDKPVVIDFRNTQRMVAGGTLLFYSELQRIKNLYPLTIFRCVPAKDDVVAQILTHLKIYELLNYDSSVVPTRPDVVNWRLASSNQIDGPAVGLTISQLALDDAKAKHLFRGATEAMVNAVNHAYQATRKDGLAPSLEKNWWMFFRQDDDRLVVAVCDLGIGIPRSLPIKYTAEVIAKAMAVLSAGHRASDARMIQAAMELQRTRTSRRGRGKGLNDLRRIVDEVPGGQLFLFSNQGLVRYGTHSYIRQNFRQSILGTVVVWIIPLGDTTNE